MALAGAPLWVRCRYRCWLMALIVAVCLDCHDCGDGEGLLLPHRLILRDCGGDGELVLTHRLTLPERGDGELVQSHQLILPEYAP